MRRLITPEARTAIRSLVSSADVLQSAEAYAFGSHMADIAETDRFKVAELAVLLDPVVATVERFLANPAAGFLDGEYYGQIKIGKHVGNRIYEGARDALSGPALELAADLASRRAGSMAEGHAVSIENALRSGSMSSAGSTLVAVEANAATIAVAAYDRFDLDQQLEATLASFTLPLAHPLVHFEDMSIISTVLRAYSHSLLMGGGYPDPILVADPVTGIVSLAKPLNVWKMGPTLDLDIVANRHVDVRTGCPISFAPKKLRVGYYQALARLLYQFGRWPQVEL